MKYYFYMLCAALLTGCTTSVVTGKKKVLGLLPIPFTGNGVEGSDPTTKQLLIEQFTPFQWGALVLIVGGAIMWWVTKGRTGMGKFLAGLGLALSIFAAVMPTIAGWVGLLAILGLILGAGYLIYCFVQKKRKVETLRNSPPS